MANQWKRHERNHLIRENNKDDQVAQQARAELAMLSRWQRAFPLFGKAAQLRLAIDTAERNKAARREYHKAYRSFS